MKKIWLVSLVVALLLVFTVGAASAQDRGSIRGAVYRDVNGDGLCVNTGVPGEEPVAGVDLEFVHTGGDYKLMLYSGDNGTYGLVAADFGYWRVTAMPGTGWVVTSQNPVVVLIDHDKPLALNVNFCVFQGFYYTPVFPSQPIYHPAQTLPAVLPVSGAPAEQGSGGMVTAVIAFVGLSLVAAGAGLEVRRRRI